MCWRQKLTSGEIFYQRRVPKCFQNWVHNIRREKALYTRSKQNLCPVFYSIFLTIKWNSSGMQFEHLILIFNSTYGILFCYSLLTVFICFYHYKKKKWLQCWVFYTGDTQRYVI